MSTRGEKLHADLAKKCEHSHIQILHQDSASISRLYFCSTYTEYMYNCMATSYISWSRQIHLLQRKTALGSVHFPKWKHQILVSHSTKSVTLASRTYYYMDMGLI